MTCNFEIIIQKYFPIKSQMQIALMFYENF